MAVSRKERFSSTTRISSSPSANSRTVASSSGHGMATRSKRTRLPARPSSAMPSRRSAASTSRKVCPAATTPRTSPGPRPTTRFSPLRRAYSRARRSRFVTRSRSSWPSVGCSSRAVGVCVPAPGGIPGAGQSAARSTVDDPSATAVTIFSPVHSPVARDSSIAWRPRSSTSWLSAGYRYGMFRSARAESDAHGRVEDLAAGSSPTRTSAPPLGWAPIRFPCRSASVARSRPGALPYQMPITPSRAAPGRVQASWLPWTAVAAASSFRPGTKVTSFASSNGFSRPSSWS